MIAAGIVLLSLSALCGVTWAVEQRERYKLVKRIHTLYFNKKIISQRRNTRNVHNEQYSVPVRRP